MDINFIIRQFESLDEKDVTLSDAVPCGDAWSWLSEEEADFVYYSILPYGNLILVNDGAGVWECFGKTPKARVIAFLRYVESHNRKDGLVA